MAVIDASVYVALMNVQEQAHTRSWAWFERVKRAGEPVVAPAILLAEVAAGITRGVGNPALAHRVTQQLRRSKAVELMPVTLALAERAAFIAAEHRVRGCDAVYLALADQLGDCLITLDEQQLERGAVVVDAREP